MKHFRFFLIVAMLSLLAGVSLGQARLEAVGFKFAKQKVVPGTVIPIGFYMSTSGFMAADITVFADPALEIRYGSSPFTWQCYLQPWPLTDSYFNMSTHEMKISIASSKEISLPSFVKVGIFYVKIPDNALLGTRFSIKVSSAKFNGIITPLCGSMEVEIGPRVMLGNPTGGGTISSLDALDALILSLQPDSVRYSISIQRFLAADVDGDYDITQNDARLILRKAVNPTSYFPIEDQSATSSETPPVKGSIEVPFEPALGGGYAISLKSSAVSGRFDISLPPGVTLEPNGISQAMFAQRYDEGTKVLSVAFASDVPSGTLFTLRGVNASNAKITGCLDGIEADIRKVEKVTDVENGSLPKEFALGQNYPNPFNPSTKISFAIPKAGNATLKVFDMQGREVATLVEGEMSAGSHEITFDAARLSSGTYFYRLQAGELVETKKMVLLK